MDVKRYILYKEIHTVLRENKTFEHYKIEMYTICVCFAIFSLITTKIVLLKIYRGGGGGGGGLPVGFLLLWYSVLCTVESLS